MSARQVRTKMSIDDDRNGFPLVQIQYLGKPSTGAVAEPYGVHGSAPKNTAALLITIGEDEGHKYIIPLSSQTRPKKLKEGEFVTGNFVKGNIMFFDKDGHITITNGTDDLVSLIKQLCEAITAMTIMTALGPQQPINLSTFTNLLTKLEKFVRS